MGQRKMSEEKNQQQLKEKTPIFGNISIDMHEGIEYSVVSINSDLFPLKFIMTAVYSAIETAYFIVDWNNGYFEVKIFGDDLNLSNLLEYSKEFQNRVTNHAFYELQSALTAPIKNLLLDASNFPYDYAKEKIAPNKVNEERYQINKDEPSAKENEGNIKESIKSELDDIDLSDLEP